MEFSFRRNLTIVGMYHRYSIQKLLFFLLLHSANGFLDCPCTTIGEQISTIATTIPRYNMAIATCVNDNIAPTHGDKRVTQRRSLRRKIPYVECFEEQISRELWEKHPFRGTDHVVDSIIGSGSDIFDQSAEFRAILTPINFESENSQIFSSGYEDSFDILYKITEDNIVHSNGASESPSGILGTASIATSPYAKIVDNHETRKEKLKNFCLRVAYRGEDFCGWQTQLNNIEQPSVQRTLEEWLTELQNDQPLDAEANAETKKERRKEKQKGRTGNNVTSESAVSSTNGYCIHNEMTITQNKKAKHSQKIRWADLPVAGRTDSGVSAIGQLCRFRTHRKDLTVQTISEFLDNKVWNTPEISRSLRVTEITPVTKAFHPTFTTSCRAYAYLIDIDSSSKGNSRNSFGLFEEEHVEEQVLLLDSMLRTIEGKALDYIGLSYGRVKTTSTLCTLHHARARLVELQNPVSLSTTTGVAGHFQTRRAVCIELVGDRFLRRMVRLLVEASMRLVAEATTKPTNEVDSKLCIAKTVSNDENGAKDALLRLIEKEDRTLVGRPAPPNGLIFVAARVQSHL